MKRFYLKIYFEIIPKKGILKRLRKQLVTVNRIIKADRAIEARIEAESYFNLILIPKYHKYNSKLIHVKFLN